MLFILCISIYISCKKPYNPPSIQVDYKYLVIDGVLLNSIDSPSVFTLSRTVKLTDTTTASFPETGATLSVEGNTGELFPFTEMPGGIYKSNPLILSSANKYRLKIITSSGEQYLSDFVTARQTPAIDSISWQQQNDVAIYINTHDPLGNTIYYKWDFVETWQYRSQLEGDLGEKNGLLYYTDSTNQTYNCWKTANSTDILVGTSAALSQDIISNAAITSISQNTERLGIRYSILVKQYAITEQAYQYFQILKKNTEQLGSIFDAQPTQLTGNIHSVSNPSEVVIGYFTASSVQQERMFINKNQVAGWNFVNTGISCDILYIDQDPNYFFLYHYADPEFGPYYFSGTSIVLTRRLCLDCTLQGGSNKKPAFW
jgi:Domain of unknown function (DUF4249)